MLFRPARISAVIGLLVMPACGPTVSGGHSHRSPVPTTADPAPSANAQRTSVRRSKGCKQSASPTGVEHQWLTVNNVARTYLLEVAADYDSANTEPLILAFHDISQDGEWMRDLISGLEDQANTGGIFVYPDALQGAWGNVNDLAFVDALMVQLESTYCIDPKRVFALGYSAGASFANQLAAVRSTTIRATAAVAGLGVTSKTSMPVWLAQGRQDSWLNISAGRLARDHWRQADQCTGLAQPTTPYPCVTYQSCRAGPVVWCEWAGDHAWPPFADAAIWSFFSEFL